MPIPMAFTSHVMPENIPGYFVLLCILFVLTSRHVKSILVKREHQFLIVCVDNIFIVLKTCINCKVSGQPMLSVWETSRFHKCIMLVFGIPVYFALFKTF